MRLGLGRVGTLVHDQHDLLADLFQIDAQTFQHAGSDALALTDKTKQQVLGADIAVIQTTRLVDSQFDDLFDSGCQVNLAERPVLRPGR